MNYRSLSSFLFLTLCAVLTNTTDCLAFVCSFVGSQISRANSNNTYDVELNDGSRKYDLSPKCIRRVKGRGGSEDGSDLEGSRVSKYREGDRVEVKVKGWTKHYPGEITRRHADNTYDIKFDDGDRKQRVATRFIRRLGRSSSSSSSSSKIKEGDRVEAKVPGWTK